MVDTIIVGKCLGVSSLAAVGSTGSINFMIIGFCTGACSGFAIPVAQKFGAGDYTGMRKFVANAGWLSAVFAVVMTTVVGALCMNILQWMNTPEDIIQGAYDYIFVIFLGIPVTYLYNMLPSILPSGFHSPFVILFFGGKHIALLFMDADQTEIIGRVAMFLIGNSMFYIPLTFVNVVRFTIQGMGFSTFAILAGVCEMAARSLVGFCLVPVFGFLPACFASPLAWIFADAFLIPAFFHCMKKLKVLFGEAA